MISVFLSGGCSRLTVLDPKGPVAEQQKDLILWSIGFMLLIIAVVYVLFTWILVKYRERKNHKGYNPQQEGSKILEIVWTLIPVLIVIALAVPTVKTIYALEQPPKETAHKKPLVIHATSVNWKWIFSYPEQNIETVNYINIPKGRPVLFKLTSADSMSSFWIPSLGGQKYAMAGMETQLYLQADHIGTYEGRNSNFNGRGFAKQEFTVKAQTEEDFNQWIKETQSKAPKLTKARYDDFMQEGHSQEMSFSSTHLEWVDHAKDPEYALRVRNQLEDSPETPKENPHKHSHSHSERWAGK
ncbi:cytochrome aa3 quinol oxidase subunit II [Paenactinomyces guangxiensis]|uniref:Quinol oxidase subunit 2 n=2 Tax=Paenactinomyces guangxiensis TaxID=1490290 RepID=A0A7W1WNV4_9BACL|nr:cytochrome aa3 quinol oxidase subunit II [Paenactinomyces guangxiensis]MBA4493184.1 cytochrome aa3 quinol oxidase subunit II [Paenactinomyces guangxiensis]MBH8589966.1 cytochrome aa3 quinol oxidase subunit II [Paenactinomyces guangxiensis]